MRTGSVIGVATLACLLFSGAACSRHQNGDGTTGGTETGDSDTSPETSGTGTDTDTGTSTDTGEPDPPSYECLSLGDPCPWTVDEEDFVPYGEAQPPDSFPASDEKLIYVNPRPAFDAAGVLYIAYQDQYWDIGGGVEGENVLDFEHGVFGKYEAGVWQQLAQLRLPTHAMATGGGRVFVASVDFMYACLGGTCEEWGTTFESSVLALHADPSGVAHLFSTTNFATEYGSWDQGKAARVARRSCKLSRTPPAMATPSGGTPHALWAEAGEVQGSQEYALYLARLDADEIFAEELITCVVYRGSSTHLRELSLAFDVQDRAHVCWVYDQGSGPRSTYAFQGDGGWEITDLEDDGGCALGSDAMGRVHLFDGDLYRVFEDDEWSDSVEIPGNAHAVPAVAPSGYAVRVWGTGESLWMVSNESGAWETVQVD